MFATVDEAVDDISGSGIMKDESMDISAAEKEKMTASKTKEEEDAGVFVIDKDMRSIDSMIEAAEYIGAGKNVELVITTDPFKEGDKIASDTISAEQAKDLNRGRKYLRDAAIRAGKNVKDTVNELEHCVFC